MKNDTNEQNKRFERERDIIDLIKSVIASFVASLATVIFMYLMNR